LNIFAGIVEFTDFLKIGCNNLNQAIRHFAEKATLALLEASVPRDQIVALLQKHWDLRRSEANRCTS